MYVVPIYTPSGDAFYMGRVQWRVFCNNGFDWLNSNKHIAVFHTEAYRWAQKSVFLVGLKLILVGLKLILVGLKLILVGLKLFLVPLKLFLVPLILFLVPLKIQTFEPNGTP